VVCSQVIEHIPQDPAIFRELVRVLRADGLLILGTPDYATIGWRLIEPLYGFFAPDAYQPGHGTHYTLENLTELARRHDLKITSRAYVFKSELILGLRKIGRTAATDGWERSAESGDDRVAAPAAP